MTKLKNFFVSSWKGILLCLAVSVPCWFLGKLVPIVGGAVFAIVIGMILGIIIKDKTMFADGLKFASKKVLQWAVILLGFGMNLNVILETGAQSLPIIVCTIAISLIVAFVLHVVLKIPGNISTLIGVGSSICGGSAIAATAPVIQADDDDVAQAISVIFFFNVIAAIVFPYLGRLLGFSGTSGDAFGIFAGTAINDTSSVTAAASTWDAMWGLGSATLDKAVTVKLTRTLAIIPITLVLAIIRAVKAKKENKGAATKSTFSFKKIFPWFILYFIAAAVITTIALKLGAPAEVFSPFKELSKFFIIFAMAAIGINTDLVKLVKTGGKPLIMGAACWVSITGVSLLMQHIMGIW